MLHVALGHVATERDHPFGHPYLDARGVDRVVQRKSLADILADAIVGTRVTLWRDTPVPARIAGGCPAPPVRRLCGRRFVTPEVAVPGMTPAVRVVAAEVATPGVLASATLVTGLVGTRSEVALVGKSPPVGVHAAELVTRHTAFVKATHGRTPVRQKPAVFTVRHARGVSRAST